MGNEGASGQQLRAKLGQKSEKAVNEYIHSSKATQSNNAQMLAGFTKKESEVKFEDAQPAKKPKLEVTVVKEEAPEQPEQPRGSPMDLTTAMQIFSNQGETSFKDCSFNINFSK